MVQSVGTWSLVTKITSEHVVAGIRRDGATKDGKMLLATGRRIAI